MRPDALAPHLDPAACPSATLSVLLCPAVCHASLAVEPALLSSAGLPCCLSCPAVERWSACHAVAVEPALLLSSLPCFCRACLALSVERCYLSSVAVCPALLSVERSCQALLSRPAWVSSDIEDQCGQTCPYLGIDPLACVCWIATSQRAAFCGGSEVVSHSTTPPLAL